MTCVPDEAPSNRMDVLGSLPFEVACHLLKRLDAVSTAMLAQESRVMRQLVAASNEYDPERHVYVGDVRVRTAKDMEVLRGVRVVVGNLKFDGEWDGKGLEYAYALEVVTKDLHFDPCDALKSLTGFSSLTTVGGNLCCKYCDSLTNVAGLASLTKVGGNLDFWMCTALTDVASLESLTTVGKSLIVGNCTALRNVAGLMWVLARLYGAHGSGWFGVPENGLG